MLSQPISREVPLLDAQVAPRQVVRATLHRGSPSKYLDFAEHDWQAARSQLVAHSQLMGDGQHEHGHWDWRNKREWIDNGHFVLVALERESECQGLMAVRSLPRPSRLSAGAVLYVDYLESAPWNLKSWVPTPRYLGVGTVLLSEAVRMSIAEQLNGCIGLHSLPQAERFYEKCGLVRLGAARR
jgi:hypothetical protein